MRYHKRLQNLHTTINTRMDKVDITKHIKSITQGSMTVFIDTPMYIESNLMYIPYTANDQGSFAYPSEDGLKLTNCGYYTAKDAVESMITVAEFFLSNKERLKWFYTEYNEMRSIISKAYEEAKIRTRTESDWRKHSMLIKEHSKIETKIRSLFINMYRKEFGNDIPVIDEEYYMELEAMSLKQSEDNNV